MPRGFLIKRLLIVAQFMSTVGGSEMGGVGRLHLATASLAENIWKDLAPKQSWEIVTRHSPNNKTDGALPVSCIEQFVYKAVPRIRCG